MSVYHKLQQARIMLQGRKLKKSGKNAFAGYEYFELSDFLPVTQEIFAELGLCGIVSYGAEVATLSIYDIEGGDPVLITSPMAGANLKGCHPIQNLGAVETYTRRYLWVTAMEIVEHDALDATTGKKGTINPTTGAMESLSEEAQQYITDIAMEVLSLYDTEGPIEAHARLHAELLDDTETIALWTRFDSKQRAIFKGIDALRNAQTLESLKDAWDQLPKYAHQTLLTLKDERKQAIEGNDNATE